MGYIGNGANQVQYKQDSFVGAGTTYNFTLSFAPGSANSILVHVGGVYQQPNTNYIITSGTTLTFTTAPANTAPITVNYLGVMNAIATPSAATATYTILDPTVTLGLLSGKNRCINPSMDIDQANEAVAVSITNGNTPYITDGYFVNLVSTTGTAAIISAQQASVTDLTGFSHALKLTVSTAASATPNAGDLLEIVQRIEGTNVADLNFGTSNAKPISVSFWAKSSVTGTYGFNIDNQQTSHRGYVVTFSLTANTWTLVNVANIPGDITGTWLTTTSTGMQARITLTAGTTFQTATPNVWVGANILTTSSQTQFDTTAAATFFLTGLQLEAGYACTNLDKRSFRHELALCQRYYEKSYDIGQVVAPGTAVNAGKSLYISPAGSSPNIEQVSIPFKITKVSDPTVTVYSANNGASGNVFDVTAAANTAAIGADIGMNQYCIELTTTGATTGHTYTWHWIADARL